MSTPEQEERAATLLERLLADPALRAEFRRRPAGTCREFDLPELAAELESGARGTVTLEQRESRSSLAGVMIAAAAEGVGLSELVARQAAGLEEAPGAIVRRVTERLRGDTTGHQVASSERAESPKTPFANEPTSAEGSGEPAGLPSMSPPGSRTPSTDMTDPDPRHADPPAQAHPQAGAGLSPTEAQPAGGGGEAGKPARPDPERERPRHEPVYDPEGERPRHEPIPDPEPVEEIVDAEEHAGYPGAAATREQIASWMASRAVAAGLPGELPVMAALTESGLANLKGGDRDSVGFFQMRVGIWDQGPYRGFAGDPDLQLKWFLDQASAIKRERVAAGNAAFGRDPGSWGEWVADVERPAEAYRGRYQGHLKLAQQLIASDEPASASGSDSIAAESEAAMAADPRSIDGHAEVSPAAERAVQIAKGYLGDPYKWGGASPETGFDCSGLIQYAYAQAGVDLPRVTHQQFEVGKHVGLDELRTGDLVFFRDPTGYIHHEGMYVGSGRFLHAPRTGESIKISSLSESYFAQQFAGGRRVGELGDEVGPDLTRRPGGQVASPEAHDARVLPTIDPSQRRPGG